MTKSLRVLMVEDNPADAELAMALLRKQGFEPSWTRVENEQDYLAQLDAVPDVIMCDHSMPQFNSRVALQRLKDRGLDIPFIYVSGTIGEENAIEAIKHGATDYLLKDRLARLGTAVTHALEQKQLRDEQKRSSEALRASEEKYRVLFNEMLVGFTLYDLVRDEQGRLVDLRYVAVNPAFERITGLKSTDVLGKTIREIFKDEDTYFLQSLWKVAETGRAIRLQSYSTKLKKFFDMTVFRPAIAQVATTFLDDSERREAEQQLMEQEERMRALLRTVPDMMFVISREGICLDFKVNDDDTLHIPGSKVIGLNIRHLGLAPADLEKHLKAIRRALARDGIQSFEYISRMQHGVPHEARVVRMDSDHVLLISRDISARKRAETERRRMENQIHSAQKFESLGILAGGIAHDFNNILCSILGNAEIALSELKDDHTRDCIADLKKAALRAAELIDQMLAYAGRGNSAIESMDMNKIVHEMASLNAFLRESDVVELELAPDFPAIEADATQVRQVVLNLVKNALDAVGEEGGTITLKTFLVHADSKFFADACFGRDLPEGDYGCIQVSDTGIGMNEATKLRIFEPFFTTKFTGRGLGLPVVLGVLRGHKGAIKVQSQIGMGTTVQVFFPVTPRAAEIHIETLSA